MHHMHHVRKVIAIAATAAAIVSVGACGSSGGASQATNKLTVAWWGNQQRNDRQQQVDDMFAKQNGITIDGQYSQFADYWQKLATNAAGRQMPDVIAMDFAYLNQYIENGLLEPLDDYVSSGALNLKDVDENTVSSGRGDDGKLYALPSGVNAPAVIYNKTLLDSLGITIPDNWTLDDFQNIAREVYAKSGVRTAYGYLDNTYNLEYNLRAHDVELFKDGKLGTEDATYYAEYFKVFENGYKEGWHLPAALYTEITLNAIEQDPLVSFTSTDRQSWCSLMFSSQVTSFASVNDSNELALAPWPSANVTKSNYVHPSMYWAVTKSSKNKDLAVKFVDFYTNNTDVADIMLTDRGIPVSSAIIDHISPKLTKYEKVAADFQKATVANSSPINPPAPAKATEINSRVIKEVEENIMYGKMDADQAAADFIRQSSEILG